MYPAYYEEVLKDALKDDQNTCIVLDHVLFTKSDWESFLRLAQTYARTNLVIIVATTYRQSARLEAFFDYHFTFKGCSCEGVDERLGITADTPYATAAYSKKTGQFTTYTASRGLVP